MLVEGGEDIKISGILTKKYGRRYKVILLGKEKTQSREGIYVLEERRHKLYKGVKRKKMMVEQKRENLK